MNDSTDNFYRIDIGNEFIVQHYFDAKTAKKQTRQIKTPYFYAKTTY